MSEQLQSLPLSVLPVINYPQEAQSGKIYLLEIDLEATGSLDDWQYSEEEYPIFCEVDTFANDNVSPLFKVRCKGTPAVVLHRFGGTYGAAKFYLTAVDKDLEGEIQITLSSAWGAPLKLIRLEDIKVRRELPKPPSKVVEQIDVEAPTQTFSIAGQEITLERKPIEIAEFVEVDDDNLFADFPPLEEFSFEVPTIVIDGDNPPPPPIAMQSVEVAKIIIEKEPAKKLGDYVERLSQRTGLFGLGDKKEVDLEMVGIPGGTFLMGSPDSDSDAYDDEKPQHEVTVPNFYIGRYPVTQAQWEAVMSGNPSKFKRESCPVEQVSWNDAVKFCDRLTKSTGKKYRLPTETEWEYACRAGTTTKYYFGDDVGDLDNYAWFNGNSESKTHPVGERAPNQFGLFDMHGNVREWCLDHWHSNYENAPTDGSAWIEGGDSGLRVIRGGSWASDPGSCRSAYRDDFNPGIRLSYIGFRVVCVP